MELYSNENNFNIFYEKKRKELKNLQTLNEFVKPNPYFVYFMFKDTIHVDDYGSIKETLFKFPTLNKVSLIQANSVGNPKLSQNLLVRWRCKLQDLVVLRHQRGRMVNKKIEWQQCQQILPVFGCNCSFSQRDSHHWRWLPTQERRSYLSHSQERNQ